MVIAPLCTPYGPYNGSYFRAVYNLNAKQAVKQITENCQQCNNYAWNNIAYTVIGTKPIKVTAPQIGGIIDILA